MDRRDFIKAGTAIAAGAAMNISLPSAKASTIDRPKSWSSETGHATDKDIVVRFIGTGAADWNGRDDRGELRRLTSLLVDNKILIDFPSTDRDMLPSDAEPEIIFYTHSHDDHYSPEEALKLGIKQVYLGDTWIKIAKQDFAKASKKLGLPKPKITALAIGQSITIDDLTITALPANHATRIEAEQTLMYLIEKGDVRIIYATDTGGIPVRAARICGIDRHIKPGKPVTGLIMEATMGINHDEDFRIFTHSSVGMVQRTADVMLKTKRLAAPAGQPVYLTHMARTLHGTQAELDAQLPMPLRAAYDGLEVIFRPQ